MPNVQTEARLQQSLTEITALLERHRVLAAMTFIVSRVRDVTCSKAFSTVRTSNELRKRLRLMHAADVAYVLESLSLGERRPIWDELEPQQAGWVLVELPGTIQARLTEATSRERLVEVLATLTLRSGLPLTVHRTRRDA